MRRLLASTLLAFTSLTASSSEVGISGFRTPVFPVGKSNSCTKDAVAVTLAPDHSAISILRKVGDFVNTQGVGRKEVKADCYLDLMYMPPSQAGTFLQIDLRGSKIKLPFSELELTIDFGKAHHKAVYGYGQVLDGTADFIQFKVGIPGLGSGKTRLRISAIARSANGRDVAQIYFDSFDACFVSSDSQEGCRVSTPVSAH